MTHSAAPPSSSPRIRGLARVGRAVTIAPILAYQRLISPAIPQRCRYYPSCSRYAVEAIRGYGMLRGLVLAGWRLLRCNPWSDGGYDPVEAQRVFRVGPDTGRDHDGELEPAATPGLRSRTAHGAPPRPPTMPKHTTPTT
ncbi:MAG: membrane protein insertion efficiency factor YidD [Solirubrobacteraceae bacterium]